MNHIIVTGNTFAHFFLHDIRVQGLRILYNRPKSKDYIETFLLPDKQKYG